MKPQLTPGVAEGTRSTVALVACSTYDPETVRTAVDRGIDLLGGVERFAAAGERILLKPNLLASRSPERAVTTHPAVFRAVAESLQEAGATLMYGDSPGFGGAEAVARKAGIAALADEMGVPLADFSSGESVSFPDGRLIKQFTIAKGALKVDGIVSLPKMKTHGLMRMTGAIKNQFGCIPGTLKAEFHARLPNADLFSQMLVDLNRFLSPCLFVMDGIVAMEGNGPQSGRPRAMNVLLLSDDPVALDATVCRLMNLDPRLVPTIAYGHAYGLGKLENVEVVGEPIAGLVCEEFDVDRAPRSTTQDPGRASRWARRFVVPKPVIREDRCTKCGTCVEVCPVSPKALRFAGESKTNKPQYDYNQCIRCYCCQEMCPVGAIEIDIPLLGRLIHR